MTHSHLTPEQAEIARAFVHVRDIKRFWSHAVTYVAVNAMLVAINLVTDTRELWFIYPLLGWGLGLLVHAVRVFELLPLFGPEWEKRQVEKRLGRKI